MSRRPIAADWEAEARRYDYGLTCSEIAERLGCSVATVATHVAEHTTVKGRGRDRKARKCIEPTHPERPDWLRTLSDMEDGGPLIGADGPTEAVSRLSVGEFRRRCRELSERLAAADRALIGLPDDCSLSRAARTRPASLRACVGMVYETGCQSKVICSALGLEE